MTDLKEYLQLVYSQELESKKNWYSSVAEAYDRARPHYPQSLLKSALQLANLSSSSSILEIGCGPGTATVDLAKFGYSVLAIEPSFSAYQLAQKNCADYANVELVNCSLEEWERKDRKFDAVVAASSFHWISPQIREQKIVECFQDDGALILLWNTPPKPEPEVYTLLEKVYQQYHPSLGTYDDISTHQKSLHQLGNTVLESGVFHRLKSEQKLCTRDYDIETYLELLTTLSQYIRMEAPEREEILEALRQLLQNQEIQQFQTSYLSVAQVVVLS